MISFFNEYLPVFLYTPQFIEGLHFSKGVQCSLFQILYSRGKVVSHEYAWRNSPTEQIGFLGDESMPDHEGAVEIPELADACRNFSPLKLLCNGGISDRLTLRDFIDQAFGHYADEGVLGAAQKLFFVSKMFQDASFSAEVLMSAFPFFESSIIRLKLSMPSLHRSPVRRKKSKSKFSCGVKIGLTWANHSSRLLFVLL